MKMIIKKQKPAKVTTNHYSSPVAETKHDKKLAIKI